MPAEAVYNDSVFINCPFDEEYKPLFRAVVFTVYSCGFVPRCALEEDDACDNRIDKIKRLIKLCRYGIHDISRTGLDTATGLPRFNMPFELGVFWGAKQFGDDEQKRKIALIMEKQKWNYQKYISDINGVDIKAHNNEYGKVITSVRNWLATASKRSSLPVPKLIRKNFDEFTDITLPQILQAGGYTEAALVFNDYCSFIEETLSKQA